MNPVWHVGGPVGGGVVGFGIEPFSERGLDEALGLAVGPWGVGPRRDVAGADGLEGVLEEAAVCVGEGIVAHDALDAHAAGGEPAGGAGHKAGAGFAGLTGQDFGVGEPRGIVDGDVQIFPAAAALAEEIKGSSDRTFGLVIGAALAVIGILPVLGGGGVRWWLVAIGGAFALVGLVWPTLLAPLNRLWTRFGLLLSRVTNPIVMALMFFVVLTPSGILMRLFGKDPLRRRFDAGARFSVAGEGEVVTTCAKALASGEAVGWFQGRMEFGPRALGARSILGDARSPNMQSLLNLKVKYRESFRPFAPSVRREDVADWFELDGDSPYMLLVADVVESKRRAMSDAEEALFGIEKLNVPRSEIPAVTHVDYSARVQTVHAETNPRYHALITAFKEETGCPVIVNTSFNVRGEPIVCTPEDAFRCFMGTEIELLAVGDCLLRKEDQDPALKLDYKDAFELD